MGDLFSNLGRLAGRTLRKGKWIYQSLAGDDAEAIQAEYEAGLDIARETRRQLKVDPDPRSQQVLNELGGRLTERVSSRRRKFAFCAVLSPEINAFALPGGFIFITRALMESCGADRDALAFILAHEMAHVVRGHPIERLIMGTLISAAAHARPAAGWLGAVIKSAGTRFIQSAYSRDQELDADLLGVRLLRSAGFDAEAAVRMLTRLKEDRPAEAATLDKYFSTHPPLDKRIRNIRALLDK